MSEYAQALPSRRFFHSLSAAERARRVRSEWAMQSRFQREFGADAMEFTCASHSEALRAAVVGMLQIKGATQAAEPLEKLHANLSARLMRYHIDDGVNAVSALLYDADARFMQAYHRFVHDMTARYFPYPCYFQATPTIRVHCPGGENAHHYPRYHSDIGYGHPPREINIWLPLTAPQAPQFHGFRRMGVHDSARVLEAFDYDFTPFIDRVIRDKPFNHALDAAAPQTRTPFGTMLAFDSRCLHSGEELMHHTRVSIDIRLLPVADYEALDVAYQGSGRRRMLYAPGHAYDARASDAL